MNNDTQTIEVEIVPSELGLAPAAKTSLETSFAGYFRQAAEWKAQAENITDPKLARTARLEIRRIRIEADKTRKELKEDGLRMGKAIDGVNNILLALIVPIEKHLDDIEKQEERRIAAEREQRIADRTDALRPYVSPDAPLPPLGDVSDEQFAAMLSDAKMLHDAKIEAARKAESDRIERERKEAEEREAQRLENIRLKAEAEKREAEMKAEREAAEKARAAAEAAARKEREEAERKAEDERKAAAELRAAAERAAAAEREAREKAEREAAELRAAAERKAVKEKAEAIARAAAEAAALRKAAAAPDKEKAIAFAATIRAIKAPDATSDDGKKVMAEIQLKIQGFAKWIEAQAASL